MPRIRTSSATELLLAVDRASGVPAHRQIQSAVRDAIRTGRLRTRAELPSSRTLAQALGLSRGVVVEAYEQLASEGYLETRPGGSTRVAARAAPSVVARPATLPPAFIFDFRPGRPDLAAFPREAWLRSIRRGLARAPHGHMGYPDGRGLPELRTALAAYLNRVRGTVAAPDDVVITTGFAQGLGLLAAALKDRGVRRFGLEDPTLGDSRDIIGRSGLSIVDVPLDEDGLCVDRLDSLRLGAVLITPAHQYPTGRVLSPDRRTELLAWAERRNGIIVEDDYDAEFRYDRTPIGALQGLRPDRVVYAGSASKVLAPGLRLGWFIAEPSLAERMASNKKAVDQGSPAIDQIAFADFLEHGELDRHLRRMRPIYRARRDRLLTAMHKHLPMLDPVGAAAGLHVLAWLPNGVEAGKILEGATAAGIGIGAIAPGSGGNPTMPGGLVFGFGSISDDAMEDGVRRFAPIIGAAG